MTPDEIKALILEKINAFTARGIKYEDVAEILNALADAIGGGAPSANTFFLSSTMTPDGVTVFDDFAAMYAVFSAAPGDRKLLVGGVFAVPNGTTYDFSNTWIKALGKFAVLNFPASPTGVGFQSSGHLVVDGVQIIGQTGAALFPLSSLHGRVSIVNGGMITNASGVNYPTVSLNHADTLILSQGSRIEGLIEVTAGGGPGARLFAYDGSAFPDYKGSASAVIDLLLDPTSSIGSPNAWAGTLLFSRLPILSP